MKQHCSKQRSQALTLVEVLVVIAVLAVLAAVLLPTNHGNAKKAL
jgi:prepilin-type N-terminal cleavage/methylation domain-containing protein